MDQRGLGSAGRRPHPDRESGVDETHAAGMQGQVIADGGSGDLGRRTPVELQEWTERIIQADREREEELTIPPVEQQSLESA